jgi:hypothetical protein
VLFRSKSKCFTLCGQPKTNITKMAKLLEKKNQENIQYSQLREGFDPAPCKRFHSQNPFFSLFDSFEMCERLC